MSYIPFIVYDLGGGHRSIAHSVKTVMEQRNVTSPIKIVEFYDDLVGHDGSRYIYNNLVLQTKWAQALYQSVLVPAYKLKIRWLQRRWLRRLIRHWHHTQPELVVSFIPLMNPLFRRSLNQAGLNQIPLVTVMTDFADCPPNFWFSSQGDHYICPSNHAMTQALALGISPDQLFQTSGLPLNPSFHQQSHKRRYRESRDRNSQRHALGLRSDLPVGLVTFGSYGSKTMVKIAQQLSRETLPVQYIFVCGHNQTLAHTLNKIDFPMPVAILTYVSNMAEVMALSDFFIGKPGNVSLTEAIAMNLPIVTELNCSTLLQERQICDWIKEHDLGILLPDFKEIHTAVAELLTSNRLQILQQNISPIQNQAVFETSAFLERTLALSYVY